MPERFLAGVLREAPKPRRRARYFWPVLFASAIFTAAGVDQALFEDRLAGGFLIFVGVWSMVADLWLDRTRP